MDSSVVVFTKYLAIGALIGGSLGAFSGIILQILLVPFGFLFSTIILSERSKNPFDQLSIVWGDILYLPFQSIIYGLIVGISFSFFLAGGVLTFRRFFKYQAHTE